jgi:predicted ATPase
LTFVGAGGSGKTRLALELSSELELRYRDGVTLVDLAPIKHPDLIGSAIAQQLAIAESPRGSPEGLLLAALRDREILLVLDNCEHLVEPCATLAQYLLQGCPGLRILATSRQPLNLPGEITFAVPPLSLPPANGAPSPAALTSDAVRLFAERAAASLPGFGIDESNASAVANICRAVDGLPLKSRGIEHHS